MIELNISLPVFQLCLPVNLALVIVCFHRVQDTYMISENLQAIVYLKLCIRKN